MDYPTSLFKSFKYLCLAAMYASATWGAINIEGFTPGYYVGLTFVFLLITAAVVQGGDY